MGRKNKETGQSSMFDLTGKPLIDYGTTEEDIKKILGSVPAKRIVEPTANKLVEVFQKLEISEKIDGNNEIISVSIPFVFYDTGVVDAIFTRKKYSVQSCIEFYFHILDKDPGYENKIFEKYLPYIEKYFSRFFGRDPDKDKGLLRKNMAFKKNRRDKSTIEGRAKQDRTNQFMKVVSKIKGMVYDGGYIWEIKEEGGPITKRNGRMESKDKFIKYPHEEWEIRLLKWMNGEEYDYPSPQGDIIEAPTKIESGKIITEIKISRDASFDEEDGLHGKVPFYFLDTGLVDHRRTIEKYTLKDCVIFYLKVMRHESHYGDRFSKLLPNIKKYFSEFRKWDGEIESLNKYLELTGKISKSCSDKIIISLSGCLDVEKMYDSHGEKKVTDIIDNILKSESPFDDILLFVLLNKFLVEIKATDEIDLVEKNKENLIKFFGKIMGALQEKRAMDSVYGLGEGMWQSYEKLFDIIFRSFDLIWGQDEDKWELTNNDKFDFENWFEERYSSSKEDIRNAVRQLLGQQEYKFVKDIKKLDFIVPMFASYMKKGENAEIVDVYKRNLIKRHLKLGGKRFIDRQEIKTSKQTNGWEDSHDQIFAENNNFIFDEFGNKILEDEEVDTIERLKRDYKIDRRKGSVGPVEKLDTISRLVKMLQDDGLLERFFVNVDGEYIVDKTTGSILNFGEIFTKKEDFWKIEILERAEEKGRKDDMKMISSDDDYSQGIGFDDVEKKPTEKWEDDDDFPF